MTSELFNVIAGAPVPGRRTFENIDPATGRVIHLVHEADADVVDQAVRAARAALQGEWGRTTVQRRAELLRAIADEIQARFERFVAAEVADTGKPEQLARTLDVPRAIANFRSFADTIAARGLDSYLTETADGGTALNYAVPKPLGVVAVISPWNLPLLLLTWKVAPALAGGNAVVAKPSEETPATATLLAEAISAAGLPEGAYNVVHGFGPDSAGSYLTEHGDIDAVTFTGESRTGSTIMRAVAPRVRPVSFELGGKNAAVVFADCDIEATIDGLARSIFTNTGQVCLCTERVYIERAVFDVIAEGLVDRARRLRTAHPSAEGTDFGPLISQQHRDKVKSFFDLAVEEGAEVLVGGGIPRVEDQLSGGFWIEPTLWKGLTNTNRVMREEIFGPAAALVPFDTEAEAIELANDTDYGLAAAVWTTNLKRGHRVAQAMNVGMAWVNTWYLRDLRSPFGGMGLSGIGREGGIHSMNFYTEPTNICIAL
ncbi:2-hydroxymuconic semialdehyde dehydrogenase [Brachybacterium sp. AOP35-5H-19]|uniref:2-hydroxymuconic semialdehyde dehydrogenase n=1 Tax=Brachybacterium sp. AOP35-5H-19 TaxID=3457685 RepID=UPI004034F1C7